MSGFVPQFTNIQINRVKPLRDIPKTNKNNEMSTELKSGTSIEIIPFVDAYLYRKHANNHKVANDRSRVRADTITHVFSFVFGGHSLIMFLSFYQVCFSTSKTEFLTQFDQPVCRSNFSFQTLSIS